MVLPLGDAEGTRIVPVATYTIIALNILAFLVQIDRGEQFTTAFAATPYEITHNIDIPGPIALPESRPVHRVAWAQEQERVIPQAAVPFPVWFTLFTAMFLHGGVTHLVGNMLYLWIFGDNVEEVLGTFWFVVVYLACGLVASLAQILATPDSLIPTLGASGAIAGIMGAYLVWFPDHRIRVLFLYSIFEVPALWMIGLWIGAQVLHSLETSTTGAQGGVAYLAHVGGAACGVAVGVLLRELARNKRRESWAKIPEYPPRAPKRNPYRRW